MYLFDQIITELFPPTDLFVFQMNNAEKPVFFVGFFFFTSGVQTFDISRKGRRES